MRRTSRDCSHTCETGREAAQRPLSLSLSLHASLTPYTSAFSACASLPLRLLGGLPQPVCTSLSHCCCHSVLLDPASIALLLIQACRNSRGSDHELGHVSSSWLAI